MLEYNFSVHRAGY